MKISVNIIPELDEEEVIVNCASRNNTVKKIVTALHSINTKLLCCKEGEMIQLSIGDILYIEAVARKTFFYTEKQIYESDKRLYVLEEQLRSRSFFRVSKSMIVNMQRVHSLRPELGARLLLTMDNGEKIVVSRVYANTIKEALEVI